MARKTKEQAERVSVQRCKGKAEGLEIVIRELKGEELTARRRMDTASTAREHLENEGSHEAIETAHWLESHTEIRWRVWNNALKYAERELEKLEGKCEQAISS